MKSTLTPAIDIIEIEENKGVYTVAYWDENFIGDNNVTIQITEAKLLEYVAKEYPASDGDLLTDKEYLELDKEAIIKDYITANS